MKTANFTLIGFLLTLSSSAFAAPPANPARLTRSWQSGFTRIHQSSQCQVFSNHVTVVKMTNGRVISRLYKPFFWPRNTPMMMSRVMRAPRMGACNIADVPTTTFTVEIGGTGPSFLLREDCRPAPGIRVLGPNAQSLVNLINHACGPL